MSAGSSVPYRMRPNKAVDRELFLSLLTRLAPAMALEHYEYIGLGGPFLEDFRLVHARLGISSMICVESEEEVHKRQLFNQPIPSIKCVHATLEAYLDGRDFANPAIIWFDYTAPEGLVSQIQRFSRTIGVAPTRSVLRITLNANPESLGKPERYEISVEVEGDVSSNRAAKPTTQEWRLERFRERVGSLFPSGLSADEMIHKNYGRAVLRVLKLAVEKEALSFRDRRILWALATHYRDGQAMVTAALVICPVGETEIDQLVSGWEFHSLPENPLVLDLPAVSSLERLTMEASEDPQGVMRFELPRSSMGEDPHSNFKMYYRIYPHFSRVEL